MTEPVVWEIPRELPQLIRVPIISAPRAGRQDGVILCHVDLGVMTHFDGRIAPNGRDVPHFIPSRCCEGCKIPQRPRWKLYLSVWEPNVSRRVIYALTRDACRANALFLPSSGLLLRGRKIEMFRLDGRAASPVRARLSKPLPSLDPLPNPLDVVGILADFWGCPRGCLTLASSPDDLPDDWGRID